MENWKYNFANAQQIILGTAQKQTNTVQTHGCPWNEHPGNLLRLIPLGISWLPVEISSLMCSVLFCPQVAIKIIDKTQLNPGSLQKVL